MHTQQINSFLCPPSDAAMTPMLNQMMVIGLVSIPGMMTGQVCLTWEPKPLTRGNCTIVAELLLIGPSIPWSTDPLPPSCHFICILPPIA